ncbi:SPW repeat domain-containing protein [Nafulsella turpanensis]|uniref:SPW repeat domain-containing protein n=1 Tax=Nafulsella turpanensis TaxID=1265690 RepID=UPI000345A427|nr:hypothetical protein [Nafulsella turpanensis]
MKTNLIPTKTHAYIDYMTAASLLTLPLIFSGKRKGVETYLPVALGAGALVQSLLTNYELGVKKKMSMKKHLQLDYMNGALMAASPFIFGFRKRSWFPHLAVGLSELAIAYFTKPQPKKKFFGIFG